MRTRYKKYSDYGLGRAEVISTLGYLTRLNQKQRNVVMRMFNGKIPDYMIPYVSISLFEHIGYVTVCNEYDMCSLREDFYGWRRKAVYIVAMWRRKNGIR